MRQQRTGLFLVSMPVRKSGTLRAPDQFPVLASPAETRTLAAPLWRIASLVLISVAALGWSAGAFAQAAQQLAKSWQTNTDPDSNGQITVGDTLSYWVRIQNQGTVNLTNVVVSDPLITPNSITCASVSPGLSCSLIGNYTVTASDESAGSINNTGSVTSNEIPGPVTINVSTPVVTRTTGMTVSKVRTGNNDPDGNGQVSVGDTLTYRVQMANTGNQPLNNVVVSDSRITPSSITCAIVNGGGICNLTGTYTVTAADASAGNISNTGSATSNEVPGPVTSTLNTAVIPAAAMIFWDNFYTITTDADGNGQVTVGDTLTYVMRVKNSGSQPLTNVVISDSRLSPSSINCGTVASGALSCALTGPYTVTAADGAAGSITNTGSATSTEVPGPVTFTITTNVVATTALSLSKSLIGNSDPDGNGQVTVGDVLSYSVRMQPTGSQPLSNVVVSDPLLTPNTLSCPSVPTGSDCTLFGTYTVTGADATAGSISNTGSVTSTQIPGPTNSNTVNTPVVTLLPAMTVAKTLTANADGDGNGQVTVGDVLTYTVTSTNTGNVVLNNVVVSDPITTPNSNTCASLAVGAACTLAGTYIVTAADQSAGSISNTGSVTSTEIPGPITSTLTTPVFTLTPSLTVAKSLTGNADGDGNGQVTVGDVLTYTVGATNNGAAVLSNVVVSDPITTPNSSTCASLAIGASCTLIGSYTVTAANASAGSINNTGSATSTQVPGPINSTLATPVVTLTPALTLAKTLTGNADGDGNSQVTVGDVLTYTVTSTNTGSVVLNNVVVSDPVTAPNSSTCASVAIGAACSLVGTYTVTAANASAGSISNTGSVTSTEVPGPTTSTVSTPVVTLTPALTLAKTLTGNADGDGNSQVTVGDVLTYTVISTNTGSVVLNNVLVSDPITTPNSSTCASLAIGASCTLIGSYTVTAANATAGSISNTGSVTSNQLPGPITSTVNTPVVTLIAAMTAAKTLTGNADGDGNGQVSVGDILTYTVTSTNTGTMVLTNVVVGDPLTSPSSIVCPSLAIGAHCTLVGTYTVTAADATASSISNTGSVTSNQLPGPITSVVSTAVQPLPVPEPSTPAPISGDQQTLTPGVTSAPIVVEFRSGGLPLVGQTITWTTTGGSLTSSTTITDANGRTSNTITTSVAGSVVVTATFAGTPLITGSSISFTLNNLIATIPTLSADEVSVGTALDNACSALRQVPNPTPAQQDLLNQCVALTSTESTQAVADALEEMLPDVAQVQTQSSQLAATAQFDNLNGRMLALRTGTYGSSLAGLSLVGPGASVSLANLGAALMGDEATPAAKSQTFDRWGLFASGSIGRGEAEPGRQTPAYDFDINGLTVGVDYRQSDQWVLGGALGVTRQDSTLAGQQGSLDTSGWSVSGYSTWYRGDSWYVDSLLSYGRNSYDHRRRIVYSLPLPGGSSFAVDQVARGSSSGSDLSAAATFGRDFHKAAWTFGVYARGLYSQLGFDGFTEKLNSTVPGGGLALQIEDRNVTVISSVLGGKASYAHSTAWGVLMPHVDLEWQREYRSDPESFRALFVNDPTGTPVLVTGDALDNSYLRVGLGLSMVLTRGRSGFVYYVRMVGRDGITQDNLTLGFRMEF